MACSEGFLYSFNFSVKYEKDKFSHGDGSEAIIVRECETI